MNLLLQFLLIISLILLNSFFVASEFALIAVRKTRIEELSKKGNRRASLIQKSFHDIDKFISATQLGITIASLALGWLGEPVIAQLLERGLFFFPKHIAFISANAISVICSFVIITVLHIVLGELAPKTIALQKSERISLLIIRPLTIFTELFFPVIWFLNLLGSFIVQPFGINSAVYRSQVHSEEEIKILLSQSGQSGVITNKEVEMVNNVFNLGDVPVKQVMVPRTGILGFNASTILKDVLKKVENHPHSRFPVYQNSIDNIIGFIHIKDVYQEVLKNGDSKRIADTTILRDVIIVPEMKKIDSLLFEMRKQHIHLAVVNDEFGGTAGIVTLEDIIESLVGEIEDEFDKPSHLMIKQKDGSFLVDGRVLVIDIKERFKMPLKGHGYTTIGGLVFGLLGHEPKIGDSVQISNISLTVKEIERKRIKLLQLKKEMVK